MKSRVVRRWARGQKTVTLKTFHAFCESLLKRRDSDHVMLDKVDHCDSAAAATLTRSSSTATAALPSRASF